MRILKTEKEKSFEDCVSQYSKCKSNITKEVSGNKVTFYYELINKNGSNEVFLTIHTRTNIRKSKVRSLDYKYEADFFVIQEKLIMAEEENLKDIYNRIGMIIDNLISGEKDWFKSAIYFKDDNYADEFKEELRTIYNKESFKEMLKNLKSDDIYFKPKIKY